MVTIQLAIKRHAPEANAEKAKTMEIRMKKDGKDQVYIGATIRRELIEGQNPNLPPMVIISNMNFCLFFCQAYRRRRSTTCSRPTLRSSGPGSWVSTSPS